MAILIPAAIIPLCRGLFSLLPRRISRGLRFLMTAVLVGILIPILGILLLHYMIYLHLVLGGNI